MLFPDRSLWSFVPDVRERRGLQDLSSGRYKVWESHTELTPRPLRFVYHERENRLFNQAPRGAG